MPDKNKIDFIESMKVLKYRPGDIIVLKVLMDVDQEETDWCFDALKRHCGKDVKVMILPDFMDIGVLREDKFELTRSKDIERDSIPILDNPDA